MLDHPWLAALALRLESIQDDTIPTVGTDGRILRYNPKFINSLSIDEIVVVLAHEALHCGFLHHLRVEQRELYKWNIACDHAINLLLLDSGLILPKMSLADPKYKGLSAEEIYPLLENSRMPCNCVLMEGKDNIQNKSEWSDAMVEALHIAKQHGIAPDTINRLLDERIKSRIFWRDLLHDHISKMVGSDDYSWRRPSRRSTSVDLYLPSMISEGIASVVICIDTSGSMSPADIGRAVSESRACLNQCRPTRTMIIETDAEIAGIKTLDRDEDYTPTKIKGGGGTDFRPAIIHAQLQNPDIIIYISDMFGEYPKEVTTPLIWLTTSDNIAPVGRTIKMDMETK